MRKLVTILFFLLLGLSVFSQQQYRVVLTDLNPETGRWTRSFFLEGTEVYLTEKDKNYDIERASIYTNASMQFTLTSSTPEIDLGTSITLSNSSLKNTCSATNGDKSATVIVYWSPADLSLKASSTSIAYGSSVKLTPSANSYIGSYRFFITNSAGTYDIPIPASTASKWISLDNIMDELNAIGLIGSKDSISVNFKLKFPSNDFKNKSVTKTVTFAKPTLRLKSPTDSRTICWNDTISLTTNITGNVDWWVRTDGYSWKLLYANSPIHTLNTDINGLSDAGIDVNPAASSNIHFRVRPAGKTYDITDNISLEYYPEPLPIVTVDVAKSACIGKNTGVITINVTSGGTPQLRYGVYPLNKDGDMIDEYAQETKTETSGKATFSGLPGNVNYEIQVQNIKDDIDSITNEISSSVRCATKDTQEISLIGPPIIDADNSSGGTTSCSYKEDGTLTVNLSFNGNGSPYTYKICKTSPDTITSINNKNFSSLAPGDYTIKVSDTEGCVSSEIVTKNIPQKPELDFDETNPYVLSIYSPSTFNIRCKGDYNGSITINATGGSTPYKYFISDSDSSTNNTISGLNAGTYSLMVKDANACTTQVATQVTLAEADSAVHFWDIPYDTSDYNGYAVSCFDDYNGQIIPYAGGGTNNLDYFVYDALIDDSTFSTNIFTGLHAGSYLLGVRDDNGCWDTLSLSLSSPPVIAPTVEVVPKYHEYGVSCFDASDSTDSQDGIVSYTISGGVPGYDMSWDGGTSSSTAITDSVFNQIHGPHTITFTDLNGCETSVDIDIEAPPVIETVIDTLTTPVCYKEDNGTLTVKATNGLPPYEFSINGNDFYTSSSDTFTFTDLTAGTYSVTARDDNYRTTGPYQTCTGTTSHELIEKERVEVDFTVFNPYCSGDIGSILATITSGPGDSNNYSYKWREISNSTVLGTDSIYSSQPSNELYYQLTVYDEQSCDRTFSDLRITEPVPLAFVSIDNNNTTCASINNGTISINMNLGGTPPLKYSINGGTSFKNDNYFDSLSAGTYYIVVEDDNGCQIDSLMTIDNGAVIANTDSLSMVTCNSFSDGYIKLSATGGQGVYEYSIDNGSTFASINEYYVSSGNYNALVRDVNTNCISDIVPVSITEPDPLSVTALLIDSSACGQALGVADQTINGGSGSFDTLWYASGNPIPLTSASSLTSGQYVVQITDLNSTGCIASDTLFVPEREAPVITSLELIKQPWCNQPLGSVKVTATGGSPAYSYQWNDSLNQTTQTAINLLAQKAYSITVTDQYNCYDDSTIVLTDGPAIAATHTTQDAACGQDNGSVTLNVTGGVSPYKFKWSDTIATDTLLINTMDNLYAGEYTVNISDSVGCTIDYSLDISNIGAPTLEIAKVQKSYCELNTGSAAITTSGGVPGYSYKWTIAGDTTTVSSDSIASNLFAEKYRVRVTDSKNCLVFENITISDSVELEPDLAIVNISPSACNKNLGGATVQMTEGLVPYSYQWSSGDKDSIASGLHSGQYTVTATDARGCMQDTSVIIVDKPDPKIYYIEQTPSACGKAIGSVTVGIEEGLPPYNCFVDGNDSVLFNFELNPISGNYESTITKLSARNDVYVILAADSNGCYSDTAKAIISDAPDMEIRMVNIEPVSCYGGADGQAEITVLNGTAPYSYQWQGNADDSVYTDKLSAYTNTVSVTDANGCSVDRTLEIPAPDSIRIINIVRATPACYKGADGSISISIGGGSQPYNYLWQDGQTSNLASDLSAGIHIVTITDSKGCTKVHSIDLDNPVKIEDTDVIKEALLCEGQLVTLDPGVDYISSTWTSNTGFSSADKTASVGESGEYYLEAITQDGCVVTDTIVLETSTNLLTAEFLMQSEATTSDTIALVEVSWPIPDQIIWDLPKEAQRLTSNTESEFIQFRQEGYYYVELTAYLAECVDVVGKYVDITEGAEEKSKHAFANSEDNLLSLRLSPNPNRGIFNVHFEFEEEAPATIEIITLTGAIIKTIDTGENFTDYSMEINMAGLPPGTYLLNLKSNGYNSIKTFIVY